MICIIKIFVYLHPKKNDNNVFTPKKYHLFLQFLPQKLAQSGFLCKHTISPFNPTQPSVYLKRANIRVLNFQKLSLSFQLLGVKLQLSYPNIHCANVNTRCTNTNTRCSSLNTYCTSTSTQYTNTNIHCLNLKSKIKNYDKSSNS
jgi:hypothetical protein